ncbi:cI repressor protein [Pseudomonas phage phiPto-bp6g]|nr:cI repressor protein [Pseudomonas phage phiPto-bp6g]
MKENQPTVGGWIWYVTIVKEAGIVLDEPTCKLLIKMYINSVTPEKAIEDLKNVSN